MRRRGHSAHSISSFNLGLRWMIACFLKCSCSSSDTIDNCAGVAPTKGLARLCEFSPPSYIEVGQREESQGVKGQQLPLRSFLSSRWGQPMISESCDLEKTCDDMQPGGHPPIQLQQQSSLSGDWMLNILFNLWHAKKWHSSSTGVKLFKTIPDAILEFISQ